MIFLLVHFIQLWTELGQGGSTVGFSKFSGHSKYHWGGSFGFQPAEQIQGLDLTDQELVEQVKGFLTFGVALGDSFE